MIGRTLSHFKITAKLGEGGMGEVYLAEDLKLKREVALKILPFEMTGSQERVDRFKREAEILASLNHPNIVTIHSVEEADDIRFLAMELVRGERLSDLISRGGMPMGKIFDIAIPLADALSVAHERGVIHRDLKPGNIMVTREGLVKVLDFGLSKLGPTGSDLADTALPTEPLTADGKILGTVPYMSPEQLEGRPLDHRTDVFSLGAILHECATGDRPFAGDNSASLISSILRDTPRDIAGTREDLPPHLGRVIKRCLEKNPDDRYQTAKDVRNELRHLRKEIEGTLSSAALSRPAVERPAFSWRPPRLAVISAVVLVTLVAVGALVFRALREPEGTVPGGGTGRRWESRITSREARVLFEESRVYRRRSSAEVSLELTERNLRRALEIEPGNPFLEGELAEILALTQVDYPAEGRSEEARSLAEKALAADSSIAAAWVAEAQLARIADDFEAAAEAALRAQEADPDDVRGHVALGLALIGQGRVEEGLTVLRAAAAMEGGEIRARYALATALLRRGELDEAAVEFKQILDYDPGHIGALNNLGTTYFFAGRYLEAVPLYRRSLDLQPDDSAASNLGTVYYYLDRMEEAIDAYQQADRLAPGNPMIENNLGDANSKLGNADAARTWYTKAVASAERQLAAGGDRSWLIQLKWLDLAKLGRYEEAVEGIRRLADELPADPDVLYTAAQVHALAGRSEATLDYTERALRAGTSREEFRRAPEFAAYQSDEAFMQLLTADLGDS